MKRLVRRIEGRLLHSAGLPRFTSNFTRDSLLAALMSGDLELLREQVAFSAWRQADGADPLTGAEPGKIHHEVPGVGTRLGLATTYNACDTTALFLIAVELGVRCGGMGDWPRVFRPNIVAAAHYLQRHLQDGLFVESPHFCGAAHFAAKVTYWKDSVLPAGREEPDYLVVYSLAHFQNARGLRAAGYLLGDDGLVKQADLMVEAGLHSLWEGASGFVVARDRQGDVAGYSSDSLHVLAYLPKGSRWLDRTRRETFRGIARVLESGAGFRSLADDAGRRLSDGYHGPETVWPYEQVFIDAGSQKFGLGLSEAARRVVPFLETAPEYLVCAGDGRVRKEGCDPQLWTLAAKSYFGLPPSSGRGFLEAL